jgi:hypothetical protein
MRVNADVDAESSRVVPIGDGRRSSMVHALAPLALFKSKREGEQHT